MGSKRVMLTFAGKTRRLYEWADELGVSRASLSNRLRSGWSVEDALTVPFTSANLARGARVEDLFWSKVEKTEACWIYRGTTKRGYGHVVAHRRNWSAHRFSFFLARGREPGPILMHLCDVRACVRPDHLREGTQKENIGQAVASGRMARGSRNGSAKLDEASVREILRRRADGETQQRLADAFGVSQVNISHILTGKTWGLVSL
jgi:DNA-binding XRE family transcriptional regulator